MNPAPTTPSEFISPKFSAPPVVETALTVQFTDVPWTAVHIGQYHEQIAERFPIFQEAPTLPPIVETFPMLPKAPQMQFAAGPVPIRSMYFAEDRATLVQVQSNRFTFNWRRPSAEAEYPRFTTNNELFYSELKQFRGFCEQKELGNFSPTYCEVVYVNHLFREGDESIFDLAKACLVQFEGEADYGLSPESVAFNHTYTLGANQGRLYAELGMAWRPNGEWFLPLKLTSRIRVDEQGMTTALQKAHDWLIKGFLTLTRADCRKERWGQND